jgi:dolichol-phosphate mannosyltransferase/undecaprenyl-phosphate 4-deoxy-4-formamido-L-arabinose transferase
LTADFEKFESFFMDYSVVIPVYKSTTSLQKIAEACDAVFQKISAEYELIFVNDSPTEVETNLMLKSLVERFSSVRVITLNKNFGQQPATLCGLENSSGNYVVTMDDDFQHDPSEIERFIEYQSHDVLIGRISAKKHSFIRNVFSRIKGYMDHLLIGKPRHIKMSSFRLISRRTVEEILKVKTPFPFIPALIFRVTDDVVNIPITHLQRTDGQSGYTIGKQVSLFLNLIINNSSFLLNLLGRIGVVFLIASLIGSAYVIFNTVLYSRAPSGWASLMVLLGISSGLILFGIGVVGEYLARIINTIEVDRSYVIKDIRSHK